MPGTVRNGIEASVADLERVCPRIPQRVIERARSILRGTFTDTLTSVTCSEWGMAAQQQYGELVEQSLAIMSDSRLESGIAHAVRLQALLTEIGEAVEENASGGLLDRVWRRRNPREMLEEHKSEIDKIKGLLKGILPSLRNAQMHLEEINVTAEMLAAEIDAWSVSALYLADLLGQGVEHVDDLLVQGRALMGTVASIREGILARRANAQQVNVLADRIQEVVLGSLPSLLEGITVRLIQKTLSPTDRRTIVEGVQEIINHLKI